ncbi:hypothetical protein HDV63DRAFT_62653 [Trichoderma sp. SZMC 28014]
MDECLTRTARARNTCPSNGMSNCQGLHIDVELALKHCDCQGGTAFQLAYCCTCMLHPLCLELCTTNYVLHGKDKGTFSSSSFPSFPSFSYYLLVLSSISASWVGRLALNTIARSSLGIANVSHILIIRFSTLESLVLIELFPRNLHLVELATTGEPENPLRICMNSALVLLRRILSCPLAVNRYLLCCNRASAEFFVTIYVVYLCNIHLPIMMLRILLCLST